jgi:hypothetical protein
MATRIFIDGANWTTAQQASLPIFEAPIDGVNTLYILRQKWKVLYENYSPLALNTAHPDYSEFKLVKEGPQEDSGVGCVTWERIYAKVPSQHVEFSTYAYNFIGFIGKVFYVNGNPDETISTYGRERHQRTVLARTQFDYYLVDGSTIMTQFDIPVIEETIYYAPSSWVTPPLITDYLWENPPFTNETNPDRSTYESWMAADAASAPAIGSSFSLVAQASKVERWMGNIWRRQTLYIKAV